MTDVYCYVENVSNTSKNSFTASAVASTTLHVPASGMSAYRSTEPWSYFGGIVTLEGEVEPESFATVGGIRYSFASNYATVVAGDTQYTGKVIIPVSVNYNGKSYTVTSIGENAFRNCSSLTTIVVPEAVWNIQKNAFNNCVFQTLMLKSAAPPTLAEGSLQGIAGTIYVPEQGLETYQNRWSELTSSIKPFEIATTNLPSNKWSRAEFKVQAIAFDSGEDYGSTSDDNPKHNVVVGTPSRDANGRDWYALDYQCDWELRKAPLNNWCNHNGDIYVRRMFCYEGELPTKLFLACGNDDAPCEYYLNGELIWSKPNGWFENEIYQMSSEQIALLKPGEMNVIAFHVHQNWGGMYADSGLYPDLSKTNISYQCGDNLTWSLDGETGTLTISGTGNMYNYGSRDSRTEAPWGLLLNTIKHIEIESGVNSIGTCAFEGCCSVNFITIPESVTGIGSNAFRVCIGLTDVYCYSETLPSINGNAFDGASIATATLHVPEGSEELYRSSSPWNKFGSFVAAGQGGGQEELPVSLLAGTWRWDFGTNSYILLTFSQEGTVRYQEYDGGRWQTDEVYSFTYSNNSLRLTGSDGKVKGNIVILSLTATTLQLKDWPDGSGSTFTKQNGSNIESAVLNGSIIGQWNIVSGSYTRYENEVQVLQQTGAQTPPYQRFAFYDNGVVEFLEYSNSNSSYHEDGNGTYTIVNNKFVYGGGDWDCFIITSFDGSNTMEVYFQSSEDKGSTIIRKVYSATLQRVTGGGDELDPTIAGEFQGAKRIFGDNLLKSVSYDSETNSHYDGTYNFHYDGNGFVTQIDRVGPSGSSTTYTITYGDKIIVNISDGTSWTATLESHGYIGKLDYFDEKGNAESVTYSYNENGQLVSVDYGGGDVFTLTYTDGDITSVNNFGKTINYQYETASQGKILNTGGVMEFGKIFSVDMENLLYYIGAFGKPTTHLPLAGIVSGMTITGNWTLDDAGRATKAVFNGSSISWNWDDNSGSQGGEQYESAVLNGSIIGQWNIVSGSYTRYENEVQVLQQTGAQTPPYQRFAFYDNGVVEFLEYSNSNSSYHEDGNGTYTIVNNKFVYGGGDWDTFIITSFDGSNNMDVFFQFSENKGSVIVRKVYTATLQRETGGGDEQETQTDNILAFADNMKVRVGSEFLMPIQMTNADAITGVQFDLYLPEGMQICVDEYGDEMIDVSRTSVRRHSIASRTMSDGALRIVISSTQNATFEGNSGTILTLKLAPENTMEAGTYEVLLKNVILTTPAAKRYAAPDVRSYINVTRYTLGDVNNDGYIDVADLAGVVRFILENADDNLIFNAADMDGNGLVEINDYAALVNVILSQNTPNAVQQHRAKAIRKPVISLSDLCLDGNGEGELVVRLDNNIMQYTGFQFDLRLPEGIELIDEGAESIGSQHGAWTQMLSDGVCRVVCASLMNEELREGDVLRLQVKVTGTMDREPEVVADNVILSDVNASRHDVASARAFVNTDDATGIRDAWGRMENGRIIYNLAGQRVQKGKKGLYIMNGKKVVVK